MEDYIPDRAMQETYLRLRNTDLKLLKESRGKKSVTDFNRLGHKLLGNARSFGFESLESIAHQMDQLQLNNFENESLGIINSFEYWIEQTKTNL
jgi:HPt (histidine-containing phosphotransfer) domain-containing protein